MDEIKEYVKKNKPIFKKWENYLKSENWSDIIITNTSPNKEDIKFVMGLYDTRTKEFQTQVGVVKNILSRINFFIKKAKQDYKNPDFKRFYKYSVGLINLHQSRCDHYLEEVDLSTSIDRQKEVDFQNLVFNNYSKIDDDLKAFSYVEDEEKPKNLIEFYEDKKASLAVYKEVMRDYPFVRAKMESLNIDFTSPPPPTIHILNENPPIWDKDKHFWEQDKETIQYYIDELKKIEYGVKVDEYYIEGHLYWHFNHFYTPLPTTVVTNGVSRNEDIPRVAGLRDTEILIAEYYLKAEKDQLWALIAATRRAAKTTYNASRSERAKLIGKKQILIVGGSPSDLGHIVEFGREHQDNCNHAFRLYDLGENRTNKQGIDWGIKTKDNKRKVHSTTFLINLEAGQKTTKKELLAGFKPDEFILDEAFKFLFLESINPIKPALKASGILRCVPIISATGGNDTLAADGIKVLRKPSDYDIAEMDWDTLERGVPEDLITWKRKEFGLFLPGQMAHTYRNGYKISLSEYLKLENSPTLDKLMIEVTDWEKSKEALQVDLDKISHDSREHTKLRAYHPFDTTDIFLSGKESPFSKCLAEAKAHKKYLEDTGQWDARKEVYRDTTGKIRIEPSTRELLPYPFKGVSDAPFLIFEIPPEKDKIPFGMYTAGFDDYKQDDSDTNSVATFYVWKNILLGDKWSKRIVASLSIHPERHKEVYEKWLLLMELFNLRETCFGENEDFKIKDYLDSKKLTDTYLARNLNFTQTFTLTNNLKRDFGWTPRTTKKHLIDLFVDYCNEEHEVEYEDGTIKTFKGVQLIDDIVLLDEIMAYSEHINVDRIIGAIGGYGYLHYLNASHTWNPSKHYKKRLDEKEQKQKTFQQSFYANNLRGTYGSRKMGR